MNEEQFRAEFGRALKPGKQCDRIDGSHGEFGYEVTNPIPAQGNWYCRRLRCPAGHPYWYHRLGSVGQGPDGHIIDRVELLCLARESRIELFFDMYHTGQSAAVPRDLSMGIEAGRGSTRGLAVPFPDGLEEYDLSVERSWSRRGPEQTFLKNSDWETINGRLCLVLEFAPLAKVESGNIVTLTSGTPYASVRLKCEKSTDDITAFITHKKDFEMLWAAFNTRREVPATRLELRPAGMAPTSSLGQEVWLVWTNQRYKGPARLIGALLPHLIVMVAPKGGFELAVDNARRPELHGMARALETLPLLTWTPDVME